MQRIVKTESLVRVHTHTISLNKNNKYYNEKGNVSLSGNYYDTG